MLGVIRRGAAGGLALWFLAGGIGDAVGAPHCPHHDGVAHGDPSAHGSHGAPTESHGPCTCVGRCHAGTPPSLAVPAAAQPAPVAEAPALSLPAPSPPAGPAIVPFSLPWGNAPPAL